MAALIAGTAGCGGGGDHNPAPSQNLEIRTWYDLDAVRDNMAGNHTLMNDLDSTTAGYQELAGPTANEGNGWLPIESSYSFGGSFNGQGYEIRDLFINRPNMCSVGLFGWAYGVGVIENLGLVNANVTGNLELVDHGCNSAGSLVGRNFGTVNNCYSTGSVTCDWDTGGLVGINGGTVSNSYYSGNVTCGASGGGLVGRNFHGSVSNSYYNYDEVLINGENVITIGALFDEDFDEWLANDKFLDVNDRLSQEDGYYVVNNVTDFKQLLAFGQNATLKFRLKSDLDLAGEPNFYVPYLAGEFDGNGHKISDLSFNFGFASDVGLFGYLAPGGKVTATGVENVNITGADDVGGLAGYNHGSVSNSYSTGSVSGEGYIGSLVGWNFEGDVSNSHATGSVAGEYGVGGLVGSNYLGTVSNCYATGSASGSSGIGGLVGSTHKGTVSDSFWDIETSGQDTSAGGTGKTTAQMQDIATFSGAGWDIIAVDGPGERNPAYIWNIVDDVTYPFLSWEAI
jgi:hypothetical protein